MCDCHDGPAPLTAERVLQEIRTQAAKRPDGLMTSDQLCRVLGAEAGDVDHILRELETAGVILATPGTGRVAIVVLGDGDDRALRRSVRLDDFARSDGQSAPAEEAP